MLCFVLFINIINKAPSKKKTQNTAPDSKKAQKKHKKQHQILHEQILKKRHWNFQNSQGEIQRKRKEKH